MDKFSYFDSCASLGGGILEEVSSSTSKARLIFLILRHLCPLPDSRLSINGRVSMGAVMSVMLYSSETWPLRACLGILGMFKHRCPCNSDNICWENFLRDSQFRRKATELGFVL